MWAIFHGWRQTSAARLMLQVVTHPVTLTLGFVASIILWMPYGFGYYDFPWRRPEAVFALLTFVLTFAGCSAITFIRCCQSPIVWFRVVLSGLSLVMALHGLTEMLRWWSYMWGWREISLWLAVWPLAFLSTGLILWKSDLGAMTVQVLRRTAPRRTAITIAIVVTAVALKLIFWSELPTMRFVIPTDFRGSIKIKRSHTGVVPHVSQGTTTFVIPTSGHLEVVGELPYEQTSKTEVLWRDGEPIPLSWTSDEKSLSDTQIYFWAACSDNDTIWLYVGTHRDYLDWLMNGPR